MSQYSWSSFVSTGATNIIPLLFPFIAQTDVHCYLTLAGVTTEVFGFSFNGVASITLAQSAASLTGQQVTVRRVTYGLLPDVTFQVGTPSPNDMNNQTLQLLYMAQEALDNLSITGDALWNANNLRIENLANPVNAQDAVTLSTLNSTVSGIVLSGGIAAAVAAAAAASAAAAVTAAAAQTTATFNALEGAVAFTGGTMNGVTIGGVTPSTGKFTTLWSTGTLTVNGVASFSQDLLMLGTGELQVPSGSTAQRAAVPAFGMMRYNTDVAVSAFEGYGAAGWGPLIPPAGVVTGSAPPQGRLALVSGQPLLLTTVSAAAIVLYTPSAWNNVPLWNGAVFVDTPFAELSNTLASTLGGPFAAVANAVFDMFVYPGAGGAPTLIRSDMWSVVNPTPAAACTMTIASPAVVTMANSFAAGQPIIFTTSGALPTGVTAGTTYYVSATGLSGSGFQFSATSGGASVVTSGTQSGTQTCQATAAITIAAPGVVTWIAHGRLAGCPVRFSSTGNLPTGLVAGTTYYVLAAGLTANTFEVGATPGGSAITTSGSTTGIITVTGGSGGFAVNNCSQANASQTYAGATALSRVQGIQVNANAITNGPASGYGTWVGTIMTDATGATLTFNPGGAAVGGVAARVPLWNRYNREPIALQSIESTTSWTASSITTPRVTNSSAVSGASFICGEAGHMASAWNTEACDGGAGNYAGVGVGLNSNNSFAPGSLAALHLPATGGASVSQTAQFQGQAPIGGNTFYPLEMAPGSSATFYGTMVAESPLTGLNVVLQY